MHFVEIVVLASVMAIAMCFAYSCAIVVLCRYIYLHYHERSEPDRILRYLHLGWMSSAVVVLCVGAYVAWRKGGGHF